MIGKTLAHYEILEKIGSGGMGEVYRARDTKLGREVALKTLPAEMAADPERLRRFEREAKAVAALNHPNIVTIHSVEHAGGLHFLTMELVKGETLAEQIPRRGLPLTRILELAVPLADAVSAAHERGITHRDLKPANIVIGDDGRLRILDFGIAKLREEEVAGGRAAGEAAAETAKLPITGEGRILGTIPYMSPEQLQGLPVDARSDIFSVGIILYEMATGKRPFEGETSVDLMSSILKDTPSPLSETREDLPRHLGRIVRRCLEKDPKRRYQTARDLHTELEDLRRELASEELLASGSTAARRLPRSRRGRVFAIAAIAALALLTIWWTQWGRRSGDAPTPLGAGADGRQMIVILPFENLGPPEDEYFAAGMTEEITSRLAVVSGLGVISRTSAVQYERTGKTIQQIGADLGVDYVLEGTVRWDKGSAQPRVRVTPQLIRVSDDTHLWANRYDRSLEDVFAVQADIAEQIIEELDVALLEPERRAVEAQPTENLLAYEIYLQARSAYQRAGSQEADFRRAETLLRQATKLDSSFALAFVLLCEVHGELYFWGFDRTEERLSQAKAAVDRALALDPDLPEAHRALGGYYYMGFMDYDRALQEYAIAAKGLPNDPEILASIGYIWRRQGLFDAAIVNFRRCADLDPQNFWYRMQLGTTYLRMRKYADAEKYFDESIALNPDQDISYFLKALNSTLWQGDLEKARTILGSTPDQKSPLIVTGWCSNAMFERDFPEALDRIRDLPEETTVGTPGVISRDLLFAIAYDRMGERERARSYFEAARVALESLVAARPAGGGLHCALGLAYAGLGRKEDAIREGRRGVDLAADDALSRTDNQWDLAEIYALVGEYDLAIDEIERLLTVPAWVSVPLLRLHPAVDPLREHPRFRRLLGESASL
jgi:TolB-like protein/Flp pilus assembly protein TadD